MASTRSPRSESFTQSSVAPVPKKRKSLERNSQAPMTSQQRSPLPPHPDVSSDPSRTQIPSASGSYMIPGEPTPLWEYPGQGIGRGRTQDPSVFIAGPRSPGTSRSPGMPREYGPQFEGPRRKLSYHPQPTPEITPLPYGPEERPKRRLIPDRRFSEFSGESTPCEEDQPSCSDESQYTTLSTRRMKPPCFKMRESMFLSDSSTPGVAPFQFGRSASTPVYQQVPPGNTRSSFHNGSFPRSPTYPVYQNLPPGNTRHQSVFSGDGSYSSTPDSDSTGYGTESSGLRERDTSRYKVKLPTRFPKGSNSSYFSESDESIATVPYMTIIDSAPKSASPARHSGNVFVLTAATFSNFLQLQNKAAVLFYNSSTNKLDVVEDMVKQFVNQNPIEERQVYASVDCAQESQLCVRENATDTPFFRMYSKGLMVKDAKDFATLTQRPTAKYR